MLYRCFISYSVDATAEFKSFANKVLQEPVSVQKTYTDTTTLQWIPRSSNVFVVDSELKLGEVIESTKLLVRVLAESGIQGGRVSFSIEQEDDADDDADDDVDDA